MTLNQLVTTIVFPEVMHPVSYYLYSFEVTAAILN